MPAEPPPVGGKVVVLVPFGVVTVIVVPWAVLVVVMVPKDVTVVVTVPADVVVVVVRMPDAGEPEGGDCGAGKTFTWNARMKRVAMMQT